MLEAQETANRIRNAERLKAAISNRSGISVPEGYGGGRPGYLRLPVRVPESLRGRFLSSEARALGIMPGYPLSLADLPGFGRVINRGAELPGARELAQRLFTFPTHSRLGEGDLRRLEQWIERTRH